ncbi:MAG: hypothetical protein K5804_17740 [Microbacterium sp.]|uniref:hypothetical protein n=1 Tax=Microbacterium sp. TaxID=51671 RepID=UPI0026017C56|nr:hypothetical protein [Microbacterium sp.]MCV0420087.1 hypothetical protein [Microbacterium sp.]
MTIEEKRRELFEAVFAKEANLDMSDCFPGEYQADFVRHYWYAFNSALDAVEIELPAGFWPGEASGPCVELQDVIESIESTGLGLKVKP